MNTKNRTIQAGLAALAMGAAVATATGPAMADIPLTPISSSPSDIAGLATAAALTVTAGPAAAETPVPAAATPVATDTGSSALNVVGWLIEQLFPKPSTDPCHGMCS